MGVGTLSHPIEVAPGSERVKVVANGGSLPFAGVTAYDITVKDAGGTEVGSELVRWEFATAIAGQVLQIKPFDQPDVEEAKQHARAELEAVVNLEARPAALLPTLTPADLRARARAGDYLAILAYVPPTPAVFARLQELRGAWARALACATTLGIGPRYLHSTGQLHKGGPASGLFLVITTGNTLDLDIPEMGTSFGALHGAQARGDIRALLARGRRVAHVHLSSVAELSQIRS